MISKALLQEKIENLIDPTCNKSLKETGGIRHIGIDEEQNKAYLIIALKDKENASVKQFKTELTKLIKLDLGFSGLKLELEDLVAKEKDTILDKEKKIKYIGIASGKGGVGKSTITANLAVTFAKLGHKVGIIDADIYGPSIPNVLDLEIEQPKATSDEKIIPFKKFNVEVISTAFLVENNRPLMWRGPMLHKILELFFYNVKWDDDIEYIFIDLPPGTGDVALDIQSLIPQCEMIVVTTPHPTASKIAVKAGLGAKQLNHNIIGVIENMSYFKNPENQKLELIFGEGGGNTVAKQLGVPLLGRLEIAQPKNNHSIFDLDEENGLVYLSIAKQILKMK
ncbi:MAG TPA: P-loop NTPase [Haloplasmataceae bacterium]